MITLFQHSFCPQSRFVRLALAEHGLELQLIEERAWERREGFLLLNPAGTTPVLVADGMSPGPGAASSAEFRDEAHGAAMGEKRLMPHDIAERIEVRRLMAWFNEKFFEEASGPLVTERIYKRFMSEEDGGGRRERRGRAASRGRAGRGWAGGGQGGDRRRPGGQDQWGRPNRTSAR